MKEIYPSNPKRRVPKAFLAQARSNHHCGNCKTKLVLIGHIVGPITRWHCCVCNTSWRRPCNPRPVPKEQPL